VDLIVLLSSVLGLFLASRGQLRIGVVFVGVPLVAFALFFRHLRNSRLLFPFSFSAWWIVLGLTVLVAILFRGGPSYNQIFPLGIALYYYGCLALKERKIRWVPPGAVLTWNEARRRDQPVAYWLIVSLVFCASAISLAFALYKAYENG
jgi:hypothetical protein